MAKNRKETVPQARPAQPSVSQAQAFRFNLRNILPLAVCLLYLAVHFIPDFDAYDVMGAQWFYLICLDLAVILVVLGRRKEYEQAAIISFRNLFSGIYLLFFAWAGISIFMAINPTEAIVCFVRLTATIIAFFNLSILLYNRKDLFRIIAFIISLIALYESCQSIALFMKDLGNVTLNELIKDIKGYAGNKNIFVAALVVKIPFILYGTYRSGLLVRIVSIITLLLTTLAVFLLNARASYLSFFLIVLFYLLFLVFEYRKEKKTDLSLFRLGAVLIPIVLAFFISQALLTNAKSFEKETDVQLFGTVTDRISGITNTNDESNNVRLRLWKHAGDYTLHHPFMGSGYGNWKIASIPYQRTITNDLYVPIHAHNDFIETFAELGIPGGLLFLSLFIVLAYFTVGVFRRSADNESKLISVIAFLALIGYIVDATFNFPVERPINQVFFALFAALIVMGYLSSREENASVEYDSKKAGLFPAFGLISLLLLIPSGYVTYLTYQSLIIQRSVLGDLNFEPLRLDYRVIVPSFPSIPNLSATAQPIDAIKGRYLYEAGKFDEALVLLDRGRKANPVIGYSEFLKAGLYFKTHKLDSARRNALTAFNMRPKAKTYYQTLMAVLSEMHDSVEIKKAFAEYDRYRPSAFGRNMYLMAILKAEGKADKGLLDFADSSLKKFALEPEAKDLQVQRNVIANYLNEQKANGGKPVSTTDINKANQFYQEGIAAFGSGNPDKDDLEKAAKLFLKAAALSPGNFIIYENAAMAYFNKREFQKSLIYFDKSIALNKDGNGKSEFFKGVALLNLGRKEGCTYLQMAKAKNYKEKEAELNAILKSHCGIQ